MICGRSSTLLFSLLLAVATLFCGLFFAGPFVQGQGGGPGGIFDPLGPMVSPAQNPLTPEKALLGKFLFWEEQLSHDNSTSCGSCHVSEFGGSDGRTDDFRSVHPGFDGIFGTEDDVSGSIGLVLQDCSGA
ncbi:MAG: cytochrome c peroxidase, partial [Planctomycetota bacterium]